MSEDDQDIDRRTLDKNRFRMDTTITITHVLTTLGMVYAVLSWGGDMKTEQAVQSNKLHGLQVAQERERTETLQALRDINKKLDDLTLRGR